MAVWANVHSNMYHKCQSWRQHMPLICYATMQVCVTMVANAQSMCAHALQLLPHRICVTAVAMAAVASTASGGATRLTASAAADGFVGRNVCSSTSIEVNRVSALAW